MGRWINLICLHEEEEEEEEEEEDNIIWSF
jgi:hypothetical protein